MAERNRSSNRSGTGGSPRRSRSRRSGESGSDSQSSASRRSTAQTWQQSSSAAARRSRGAVSSAKDTVVDAVRQHPLPAALVGAGLTWLLLETRPARQAERKLLEQARRAAGAIGEPFSGVPRAARSAFTESAENTRGAVREGAGTVADYAKNGVSTAGEALRSGASAVGRTAQRGYMRGRETLSEQWDRHPLAMGLALLCAGLASGMLLPSSRKESETFGRASDDLSRRVKETGEEILERGREIVASSRRAVERASRREGLSPASVGKKMRRVVKRAAKAATKS
jgi:hypothetical protein